ncbi:Flp pilus assembly protein CpaB [Thioclava sp. GXIMD4216]|uniref:Flp pilus assembly protein CpaB n=1 Tax=Thioclava litoralis TaxID=3076557 RepID=A0ABZ1E197_9RHOB|nr:Flp pilus assembly protein CpaB [Thioclava sp. FTW29]
MRLIFGLVFILGVALAGMAVYMTQGKIAEFQAQRDYLLKERQSMTQMANMVVVKHALKYGERFTQADLEVIKVQQGKLPEGAFSAISAAQGDEATKAAFLDGETRPRAALRSYEANEPLLASKITKPGIDAGITARLAADMRAFTIGVNAASGVSGFLRPGDHVDVYWYGRINNRDVTKLIQTNLKLIAVDQNADADRVAEAVIARTVTAEVSPEQVAALTLAQSTGQIMLALVGNTLDTSAMGPIEIDRDQLLGTPEVAAAPAPKVCTIKTRKGSEVIETPIPCTN